MRMSSTDLLDAVKLLENLPSDYALAKRLGVKTQNISNYRTGRTSLDVDMCFRLAEILGFNAAQVVTWIEAERAEKAHREVDAARWLERAKRLAGVAAVLLAAVGLVGSPAPAEAAAEPLCITSNRRKGKRRALAAAATRAAAPLLAMLSVRWSGRA